MTPPPQPHAKDLKAIEDYIYSSMNHTEEWRAAEQAYQNILAARSRPTPFAKTEFNLKEYGESIRTTERNATLDDAIKTINRTSPDCIQGEDIEQENGDQNAWTIKTIKRVLESLRTKEQP